MHRAGFRRREFVYETDAELAADIHEEARWLNYPPHPVAEPTERDEWLRYFREKGHRERFLTRLKEAASSSDDGLFVWEQEAEGTPAAFLWLKVLRPDSEELPQGLVAEIGVAPAWRGRHLALNMVGFAYDWFRERGTKRAKVIVGAKNSSALRLFHRLALEIGRYEMEKLL